jgi:hypothetical protein
LHFRGIVIARSAATKRSSFATAGKLDRFAYARDDGRPDLADSGTAASSDRKYRNGRSRLQSIAAALDPERIVVGLGRGRLRIFDSWARLIF